MKSILIALLLPFNSAWASGVETFSVSFVGCFSNGNCFVGIGPSATTTECPSKQQLRLDITLPGSQAQYSAALTAFSMGKKIRVEVSDNCMDGFPTPNFLHVNNL